MKSSVTAAAIEYLVKFGEDLGLVNGGNSKLLSLELRAFNSAIAEFEKSAKTEAIDLQRVFSKHELPQVAMAVSRKSEPIADSGRAAHDPMASVIVDERVRGVVATSLENGNGNGGGIVKSAMRQSAILERIRQNNSCRLKDVQEWLTDVSERTIRYDLQNLIGQGLVERIGNGGPATFYRIRA